MCLRFASKNGTSWGRGEAKGIFDKNAEWSTFQKIVLDYFLNDRATMIHRTGDRRIQGVLTTSSGAHTRETSHKSNSPIHQAD